MDKYATTDSSVALLLLLTRVLMLFQLVGIMLKLTHLLLMSVG